MNIELITKSITLVASLLGTFLAILEFRRRGSTKIYEDYKFFKDFLNECRSNPDMHPFLIELGYLGITHDRTIKTEEAKYLLELENPDVSLFRFKKSRRYVFFSVIDQKIKYKSRFSSRKTRAFTEKIYFGLYAMSGFLALFPVMYSETFMKMFKVSASYSNFSDLGFISIWIALFSTLAVYFLNEALNLPLAEKLVEFQRNLSSAKK